MSYTNATDDWSVLVCLLGELRQPESAAQVGTGWNELTVPASSVERPCARASQPIMVAISCTRRFVSAALVEEERSWLSFARTHGWLET